MYIQIYAICQEAADLATLRHDMLLSTFVHRPFLLERQDTDEAVLAAHCTCVWSAETERERDKERERDRNNAVIIMFTTLHGVLNNSSSFPCILRFVVSFSLPHFSYTISLSVM